MKPLIEIINTDNEPNIINNILKKTNNERPVFRTSNIV